jgi:D-Tyr-tRNAtyr deacylase
METMTTGGHANISASVTAARVMLAALDDEGTSFDLSLEEAHAVILSLAQFAVAGMAERHRFEHALPPGQLQAMGPVQVSEFAAEVRADLEDAIARLTFQREFEVDQP